MPETLVQAIIEADNIALVSHINPDGDGIGSLIALKLGLEQIGKTVDCIINDKITDYFDWLNKENDHFLISDHFSYDKEYDLLICCDISDTLRTGIADVIIQYAKNEKLGLLDHHPRADISKFKPISLVDTKAAATCEITYKLLIDLGVKLNARISTALLTGIYTDTGGFLFSNTTNHTLNIAAELMYRGARFKQVSSKISHSKSVTALKMIGQALNRLKTNNNYAISVLDHKLLEENKVIEDDLAGITNKINVLNDLKFSLLLTEIKKGQIRGALRTNEGQTFDVSKLAKLMGGGGHPKASGFLMNAKLIQTEKGWKIV